MQVPCQNFAVLGLALPDREGVPTVPFECLKSLSIPNHIPIEFLQPKGGVGLWRRATGTPSMPVPEAPVNENDGPELRHNNIWGSRHPSYMEPITISGAVKL